MRPGELGANGGGVEPDAGLRATDVNAKTSNQDARYC